MKYIVLLGRILYCSFLSSRRSDHFTKERSNTAWAKGCLWPAFLSLFLGFLAFLGGLSILVGYKAALWRLADRPLSRSPSLWGCTAFGGFRTDEHQMQMIMFLKNMSMLGAALMITQFGSGPYSLSEKIDVHRGGSSPPYSCSKKS